MGAIACRLELTPEKDAARQYIMIVGVYAPWRDRYAERRYRPHVSPRMKLHLQSIQSSFATRRRLTDPLAPRRAQSHRHAAAETRAQRGQQRPVHQAGVPARADEQRRRDCLLHQVRVQAERRRAEAIAEEQQMKAKVADNRSQLVLAEAEVPMAMADAFRAGRITPTRTTVRNGLIRIRRCHASLIGSASRVETGSR